MTIVEALCGSQYDEIQKRGGDGNKGRLNANLLLAVIWMLAIVDTGLLLNLGTDKIGGMLLPKIREILPYSSGKTIGKILAIPFLGTSYFFVSKTSGSEENFKRNIEQFYAYPEEVRNTANRKFLTPFFGLLVLMIFLLLIG
jgi:hypothetical protein